MISRFDLIHDHDNLTFKMIILPFGCEKTILLSILGLNRGSKMGSGYYIVSIPISIGISFLQIICKKYGMVCAISSSNFTYL